MFYVRKFNIHISLPMRCIIAKLDFFFVPIFVKLQNCLILTELLDGKLLTSFCIFTQSQNSFQNNFGDLTKALNSTCILQSIFNAVSPTKIALIGHGSSCYFKAFTSKYFRCRANDAYEFHSPCTSQNHLNSFWFLVLFPRQTPI